ncbi:MAG: hypothetical protein HZC38_05175 [Chloroflexi bacterium]|nr:hypothetical protein [Chloroflexota bacterium]MBI5712801.1 hypothetical protein [Chloroflexota bacterium]
MTLTAIVMLGKTGHGTLEKQMGMVYRAALRDVVALLKSNSRIDRIVVAAPSSVQFDLPDVTWDIDSPDRKFHFGERLAELIQRLDLDRVIYMGAGSAPLLSQAELGDAVSAVIASTTPTLIANNAHSADWAAFSHSKTISQFTQRLERDNMLAHVLRHEANFDVRALKPSAGTRLDIDTPFDLRVLALHPRAQPHLRKMLDEIAPSLNVNQIQKAIEVLRADESRITLIGRVSSAVCGLIERETRCWTRVLSEERGMAANRRQTTGQVFSFVADHIERVGEEEFITQLAKVSDVVFWDTRVYLAHHQIWPSEEDRFAADLGRYELIEDDRLRRLTCAAESASIPIIVGGHNAVSGGLYAMMEIKNVPKV